MSVEVVSTAEREIMWHYDSTDTMLDLADEVKFWKKQYGVHSLEHIPESELVPLSQAYSGDLVRKGKHVGIVFDVFACGGNEGLRIVFGSLRVITHTRKPL